MRKLGKYLAVSIGFVLLVSVIAVSIPQTGHSTPAAADRDVRVVNTTAEAVPVAVQGSPSVSINNIPGNPIAVAPQGTTQVAGTVTVANQPAAPAPPIPVQLSIPHNAIRLRHDQPYGQYTFLTVPQGKLLTVEHAHFWVENGEDASLAVLWGLCTSPQDGLIDTSFYNLPEIDGPVFYRVYGGHLKLLVPAGCSLNVDIGLIDIPEDRVRALLGSIIGYLSDAPPPITPRDGE